MTSSTLGISLPNKKEQIRYAGIEPISWMDQQRYKIKANGGFFGFLYAMLTTAHWRYNVIFWPSAWMTTVACWMWAANTGTLASLVLAVFVSSLLALAIFLVTAADVGMLEPDTWRAMTRESLAEFAESGILPSIPDFAQERARRLQEAYPGGRLKLVWSMVDPLMYYEVAPNKWICFAQWD